MADHATLRKALGTGVSRVLELVPKERRPLAPMSTGEREELTSGEVAGMRSDNIEKASFLSGIAEGFKRFEMGRCDVHSVRICAVISRSSRMRRKREASSARP